MRTMILLIALFGTFSICFAQRQDGPGGSDQGKEVERRNVTAAKADKPKGKGEGLSDTRPRAKDKRNFDPRTTGEDVSRFAFLNIPTFLNGSNIDPSPVSNASLDLANEELRLKFGFPSLFKRYKPWTRREQVTATLSPYTAASKQGKATLFSSGSWTGVYGLDIGLNVIPRHIKWVATQVGADAYNAWSDERLKLRIDDVPRKAIEKGQSVSELIGWVSFRMNMEQKEYTLFFPGSGYDDLLAKRTLGLGRGYASFNFMFHSILKGKRWWNWLASAGYGKGSFTNYLLLPERTLQQGTLVNNTANSSTRLISEPIVGRVGPMLIYTGPVAYVEGYKTVFFFGHAGEVRVGARYDFVGMGTANFNTSLAPGFFINAKKPGKKPDDDAVDIANVAIIFQMDQFQLEHNKDYWDKYATLTVSAAFPLRFR